MISPLRKGLLARLAFGPPLSRDGIVGDRLHVAREQPLFLVLVDNNGTLPVLLPPVPNPLKRLKQRGGFGVVVNDKIANVGLVHALQNWLPHVVVQFSVALVAIGLESNGTAETARCGKLLVQIVDVVVTLFLLVIMPKPRRGRAEEKGSTRSTAAATIIAVVLLDDVARERLGVAIAAAPGCCAGGFARTSFLLGTASFKHCRMGDGCT